MLVGGHVSSAGGIYTAIDRLEEIGGNALQVFTQSPRMWRPTAHAPESLERFRQRRAEARVGYVVCHALYLINLASPDPELYEKSVTALHSTLDVAREIEADVVFHVGSHLGSGFEAGLERVLPAVERAHERTSESTWLLLENSAGAGGCIGRSLDELTTIVERLGFPPRLGVCLDSCHLWVSGIDVSRPAAVEAILAELDSGVGLERPRAVHVNDAAAPFGSNRDRHANLLEGEIGTRLRAFVSNRRIKPLPQLLETPGSTGHGPDAAEIQKLRRLRGSRAGAAGRAAARA
jgi:deoxyribonuclease-4